MSPYWSGSLLVDNTIRMTALAEARWGAGQGAPEQIYVHLGGGVGACVIVADRIGGGSTGYAGRARTHHCPRRDASLPVRQDRLPGDPGLSPSRH